MKILVVDLETTGLSPTNDKIVEVGIVELCLKSGARKIVCDKVFNPGMDAQAIENSWICKSGYMTPESIINGAKFEDEKDAIQRIVSDDAMHEAEIVFELHTKGAFIREGAEA